MSSEPPIPAIPDIPELTDTTKPCPLCCEPINPKARLCKHCKGDLSWRRHLGLSATSLAMLTALVAVIGNVIPIIEKFSKPVDAVISASIIGVEKNFLDTLVSNHGGTKAVVLRAALSVHSAWFREFRINSVEIASDQRIVDEGKTARIRFEMIAREPEVRTDRERELWDSVSEGPDLQGFTSTAQCQLAVEYVTGKGIQTSSRQTIDCDGLASSLVADEAQKMVYLDRRREQDGGIRGNAHDYRPSHKQPAAGQ